MPVNRQKLPFMFEVLNDKGFIEKQYILPINPEEYTLTRPTRASITMTKAGAFEDNVGHGLPKIKIGGVFGFRGTKYPGSGAVHLKGEKKTGFDLFLELQDIFVDFYAQFADHEKSIGTQKPILHFYDYGNRDYFRVQLNQFTLKKDIQRRMLYQYNMDMTVLGRILPSIDEQAMISIFFDFGSVSAKASWLTTALKAYAKVMSVVSAIIAVMEQIEAAVGKISIAVTDFRNGVSKVINISFSLVVSTINAVEATIRTIASFSEIPHEITRGLRDVERALLSLKAEKQIFIESTKGTTAESNAETNPDTEILTGLKLDGNASTSIAVEESLFAQTPETLLLSAQEVAVTEGESIQSIAKKTGANWKDIVSLNNLTAPYIGKYESERYSPATGYGITSGATEDAESIGLTTADVVNPGDVLVFRSVPTQISAGDQSALVASVVGSIVNLRDPLAADVASGTTVSIHGEKNAILLPGEMLRIPGTAITAAYTSGGQDFDEDTYGIDEELDAEGFMVASPSGDISTKSGLANLEMALNHRINTARGELSQVSHENYGSRLPEIVGKISNEMWQERALFEAELAVLQDPRIEKVVESSFLAEGTALYISVKCTLVGKSSPEQFRLLVA
jgi:phage baseplate assembly protein W